MSWNRHRTQASPAPGATAQGVPLYNPNQHTQPTQWPQQNFQSSPTPQQYAPQQNQYAGTTGWYNQTQIPQGDNYQQINPNQNRAPPTTQYWQPPQNQTGFSNVPLNQQPTRPYPPQQNQQFYQNAGYQQPNQNYPDNFYQPAPVNQQRGPTPNRQQQDDPWNWGWGEEPNNSNNNLVNNHQPNNIADSFTNPDDTWNWTVDDSNSSSSASNSVQVDSKQGLKTEMNPEIKMEMVQHNTTNNLSQIPIENDPPNVKFEQMGPLAAKHRLPPNVELLKTQQFMKQESTESQISQESTSDDLLQTSDEKKLSRSSTISQCPSLPNQDFYGEHSAQQYDHVDENIQEDKPFENAVPEGNQEQELDEMASWNDSFSTDNTIQSQIAEVRHAIENLALQQNFENKEIVSPETSQVVRMQQPPAPPPKNITPPLNSNNSLDGVNPYKRNAKINAYVPIANQVQDSEVNLETVPDNVERPDQIPSDLGSGRSQNRLRISPPTSAPLVENLEVAPKNDRNQYLETGQLSESYLPDYQNNDGIFEPNTEEPPPGLRRMVLGHTENDVSVIPDSEEPRILTGLDRVIDGEPENVPSTIPTIPFTNPNDTNDELPAGLHRMVPGESSSPESNSRWPPGGSQNNFFRPASTFDTEEVELQNIEGILPSRSTQRSETIGADTPPTQNDSNSEMLREGNVDGDDAAENNDTTVPNEIDVQTTVRSQTDGENTKDTNKDPPRNVRPQRTDSSEDDREVRETSVDRRRTKSPSRYENDRKYYRGDSPDRYWDRKDRRRRDRYYEEDTDYYSDKERERHGSRRPPRDSRGRDDYDRSYSSLRRNDRDHHPRDYDRAYSSLRREYDRDKPRTGERGPVPSGAPRSEYDRDERGRRDDYYYARYEDDYYGRDSRSSRPSSRSDSNYRERIDHRPKMDPYNTYYQGYGYDSVGATPNAYYAAHYQQHYQYYENMRRTNPAAYAEWYRKYMQGITCTHTISPTTAASGDPLTNRAHEDKASVHSGRSSANEELHKDRYASHRYYSGCPTDAPQMGGYYSQPHTTHSYNQENSRTLDHTDSSLNLEEPEMSVHRLTPAKFSTAHIKADISSGHYIQVLPHYPIDGQAPIVEILDLQTLLADDPEQQELNEYPGPLIKGVTHKKTLIEFCESKVKRAQSGPSFNDRDSYVLMWELLMLLLRQNGVVVGTDIAELLMKNASSAPVTSSRRASAVSSINSVQEEVPQLDLTDDTTIPNLMSTLNIKSNNFNETYVTNKFREYLIYGSGKEALEWAMKHGLWGHALFLASKLDKRTYANVMMRFANGLTINDPLQTLYQLLSGRQPAAATCVSDEKWGDWRPHLAMILSNTSHRPELDRKAITTLGDTLQTRGSLYAAHFCYLMAQTGFGSYGSKSSRLVLLGSSHQKSFTEFATNEAIIMTEIYEYACSLSDPSFNIAEFQVYKYLMATKLAERGFLERALSYTERIGVVITQNPTRHSPTFSGQIVALAERLSRRDTLVDTLLVADDDSEEDNVPASPNIEWLANLKSILSDYDMGLLTQDVQSLSNLASSEQDITQSVTPPSDVAPQLSVQPQQTYDQSSWNQQTQHIKPIQQQSYQTTFSQQPSIGQQQQQWAGDQSQQWPTEQQKTSVEYQSTQQQPKEFDNEYQEQQNQYWNQQQWSGDAHLSQQEAYQQQDDPYWNSAQKEDAVAPRPQITMPNSGGGVKGFDDDEPSMQTNGGKAKSPLQNKDVKPGASSSGWFGGIWNKLSLRPKNQMILPDDKNPTIVWDSEKKRWVNLDSDGNETSVAMGPPPKMNDMFSSPPKPELPQMNHIDKQPQSLPPQFPHTPNQNSYDSQILNSGDVDLSKKPPAVPNMFKMQRGRGKKAYVDVFNPSGVKGPSSLPPAVNVLGASSVPTATQMNYFVPAAVVDPNAPVNFLTATGIDTSASGDNETTQANSPGYNTSQYSQGVTMGNQYSQ